MQSFWEKLNKPFFCLAPMEEVTDVAFREMFARYSGRVESEKLKVKSQNDFVMYTEFVNVDGLTHPEGYKKLSIDLKYTEAQRPIVAQIWGRSPLKFEEAARIVSGLGFDGIDINMGCPQDKEIGLGSCAALIREPQLAIEIIKFTKKGAGGLPVSVKTRIGYTENTIGNWTRQLLSAEPAAIAVHGRTKLEKSKVPADWGAIAEAVKVRNEAKSQTLIIGNGDIQSREEGLTRIQETGCDGIMIGRGAFGNPWIFNENIKSVLDSNVVQAIGLRKMQADGLHYITPKKKLLVMLEHAELFEKWLPEKPFAIMRKHFKAYSSGFEGAHELRAKLMETKNLEETRQVVEEYLL